RRHTRFSRDWSSDVCSSDLPTLPCHPRIAHMLLEGKRLGYAGLATDVAALLEERDPLGRDAGVDITYRIEALRRHRDGYGSNRRLEHIEKVARSYRKLLGAVEDNEPVTTSATGLLLAHA